MLSNMYTFGCIYVAITTIFGHHSVLQAAILIQYLHMWSTVCKEYMADWFKFIIVLLFTIIFFARISQLYIYMGRYMFITGLVFSYAST